MMAGLSCRRTLSIRLDALNLERPVGRALSALRKIRLVGLAYLPRNAVDAALLLPMLLSDRTLSACPVCRFRINPVGAAPSIPHTGIRCPAAATLGRRTFGCGSWSVEIGRGVITACQFWPLARQFA